MNLYSFSFSALRATASASPFYFSTSFDKYIRLFTPLSGSLLREWMSYLNGQRTEYNDPVFVAQSEGRQGMCSSQE
jgi:hypothetical protein